MELGSNNPQISRLRFSDVSAELLRSNRDKVRALRESLAQLSEARGDSGRAIRDEAVRARLQAVRERQLAAEAPAAEERGVDRVEISEQALALSTGSAEQDDDARTERLEELRQLFESGRLVTPERLERTATSLLGAEQEG